MTSPYRLGFPRLVSPSPTYNRENEAQFRLAVEQLLKQVVQATNDTVNGANSFTSTLNFIPDNTIDVGNISVPYRPRTVYAGTSVSAPSIVGTTRVTTPRMGTLTATDLILDRGGVTQLTLASLAATFAGTVQGTTLTATTRVTSPLLGTTTAADVVFDRNSVTQLTLGSLIATFAGGVTATGHLLNATDNTYDIGASGATRFRTGYFGTSIIAPTGTFTNFSGTMTSGAVPASLVTAGTFGAGDYVFPATVTATTSVVAPLFGTTTAVDVVFRRNSVTQLTLGSLAATFAGAVTADLTGPAITAGSSTGAAETSVSIRAAAGQNRFIHFRSGTLQRWQVGANSAAESTGDLGSNLVIRSMTDAGTLSETVLTIGRAAGTSIAFLASRPITGGTYNGQTISSAASFTGTVAVTSTLTANNNILFPSVGSAISAAVRAYGPNNSAAGLTANVPTGGAHLWSVNGVEVGRWNAAGLTVTNQTGATLLQLIRSGSGNNVAIGTSNADGALYFGMNSSEEWAIASTNDLTASPWLTVTSAGAVTSGTYNGQTISSAASFTGTVTIGGTNLYLSNAAALITMGANVGTSSSILLNSAASALNIIRYQAAGVNRWALFTQGVDEPWMIRAYDDAGALIDNPLTITRAAGGTFAISRPVTMASSLAITGALSGVTTLAISSDVTYSDTSWIISPNTSDGADTSRAFFSAGGGTAATNRGAFVGVNGNEQASNPGRLQLYAGGTGYIETGGSFLPVTTGADDLGSATFQFNRLYLDNQVISSLATGTAPFSVASTTKVANLNADLLDDQEGSYYLDVANLTGTTLPAGIVTSSLTTIGTLVAGAVPASLVTAGTFTGAYTFDTDITYSATNFTIKASTSDGSDNNALFLAGGGAASTSRGAYIRIAGMEYGGGNGALTLASGVSPSTGITLLANAHASSGVTITPGSSGAVNINGSGIISVATEVRTPSLDTVGATNLTINRNNTLVLTVQASKVLNAQDFDVASGKVYRVNNTQVVAAQGAAVADATGAGDVVAQLNALLARVRAHGLIAT